MGTIQRYDGSVAADTFLEADFTSRFVDNSESCPFEQSAEVMERWRSAGATTVFMAGTFDILTINHVLALAQCRLLGALAVLSKEGQPIELEKVQEVAASDAVRLMVTVDTDTALERSKSRRPDKGNVPKPTMGWQTRAAMVAMQSVPSAEPGQRRQAADFVTVHGPESCKFCPSCINLSNSDMAAALNPDVVVVSAESTNTINELARHQEQGRLTDTLVVVVGAEDEGFTDPILGGLVSTTNIIKRTQS